MPNRDGATNTEDEVRDAVRTVLVCSTAVAAACAAPVQAPPSGQPYDLILRGGTIVDGSGNARYRADVGIRGASIASIGTLSASSATIVLDVTGLMVAPGFINLHSHAQAGALPTAVNMLTQGVTTEILNPDGGGPLDIAAQLTSLNTAGLAVNVGAYAGFNSVWSRVVGATDRRPTDADITAMRTLITDNLTHGAWGVSAGLDYKPAYYARVSEVAQALEPARQWRTNFTNHDRLTPETGFSSRLGMMETLEIGDATGMIPVFTHMKVQGREQGSAGTFLNSLLARDRYSAADAYPYVAGQTGLGALLVPGWAQEGGRTQMLERFKIPEQRARIVTEIEEALNARFNGAEGVLLPATRTQLVDTMRALQITSAGEAVVRILETGSPSAILRFGSEADVVGILQHPTTSIACDCGASTSRTGHPRGFGSFPRVLGRYVREQKALTWEDAIRKMSALPANTIGMVDRGYLAVGMAADIVVFDSSTVIDHATYDSPVELSEGIRHVLVNGRLALRDGTATGEQFGQTLRRATYMPSRPMSSDKDRSVAYTGGVRTENGDTDVAFDVTHLRNAVRARGTFRMRDPRTGVTVASTDLGVLQTTDRWASFTGRVRLQPSGDDRAFVVVVEQADPFAAGQPTVTIEIEGLDRIRGVLTSQRLTLDSLR